MPTAETAAQKPTAPLKPFAPAQAPAVPITLTDSFAEQLDQKLPEEALQLTLQEHHARIAPMIAQQLAELVTQICLAKSQGRNNATVYCKQAHALNDLSVQHQPYIMPFLTQILMHIANRMLQWATVPAPTATPLANQVAIIAPQKQQISPPVAEQKQPPVPLAAAAQPNQLQHRKRLSMRHRILQQAATAVSPTSTSWTCSNRQSRLLCQQRQMQARHVQHL